MDKVCCIKVISTQDLQSHIVYAMEGTPPQMSNNTLQPTEYTTNTAYTIRGAQV